MSSLVLQNHGSVHVLCGPLDAYAQLPRFQTTKLDGTPEAEEQTRQVRDVLEKADARNLSCTEVFERLEHAHGGQLRFTLTLVPAEPVASLDALVATPDWWRSVFVLSSWTKASIAALADLAPQCAVPAPRADAFSPEFPGFPVVATRTSGVIGARRGCSSAGKTRGRAEWRCAPASCVCTRLDERQLRLMSFLPYRQTRDWWSRVRAWHLRRYRCTLATRFLSVCGCEARSCASTGARTATREAARGARQPRSRLPRAAHGRSALCCPRSRSRRVQHDALRASRPLRRLCAARWRRGLH
jgi:hypothetical protein